MNQDQQRKRRNPTQTTPDDDEAQEADVTGAEAGDSPRRQGTQVAAESEDADFDDENAATDEDDADDEDDEEPIGGRV
jgi:hypothetical protein